MHRRHFRPLLAAAMLLFVSSTAHAWMRAIYEDAQVVDRSSLIVVAHLKPGSLQYVDRTGANEGHSWDYHATLVITQTLKGKADAQEIPVTLFYGIEALVEGKVQHGDAGQTPGTFPKGSIQLLDYADHALTLCQDATQDNLWLLQRRSGERGEKTGAGDFGITDPAEIQPLALLDYYKCYLAPDPEAALKAYLPQHPDVATRADHFFDHLGLQRAGQIKDPVQRVEKILPYFTRRFYWGMKYESYDAMVAAGPDAAGTALLKLFDDPSKATLRGDIMNVWAQTHYQGCVDTLVALLKSEDQYWSTQKLEAGWWNKDVNSELHKERLRHYSDLIGAVRTLGALRDPRAREVLETTLARAQSTANQEAQIIQEVSDALKNLPAAPK